MRLLPLFVAVSLPLIGLFAPEIWHDAFDALRRKPYWIWIQVGFGAWLAAVGIAAWAGRFSKTREEKIAMTFLPGASPFEEVMHGNNLFMMALAPGRPAQEVRQAWVQKVFRVRLENLTDETQEGVALHLDRFDPTVSTLNDMPLHQMHDNPDHESHFQRTFTLPPKGHKDIDVVFKNSLHEPAALFHTVYNISQAVPRGRHEIVLRGFGKSIEPRYWRFVIVLNQDGELDFRPSVPGRLLRAIGARTSDPK